MNRENLNKTIASSMVLYIVIQLMKRGRQDLFTIVLRTEIITVVSPRRGTVSDSIRRANRLSLLVALWWEKRFRNLIKFVSSYSDEFIKNYVFRLTQVKLYKFIYHFAPPQPSNDNWFLVVTKSKQFHICLID